MICICEGDYDAIRLLALSPEGCVRVIHGEKSRLVDDDPNHLAFTLRQLGAKVEVLTPARPLREKEKSVDWLDILVEEGPDGTIGSRS